MKMSGKNLSEEMKPIHVKVSENSDGTNNVIPTTVTRKTSYTTKKTSMYQRTALMMIVLICTGIAGLSSYHFIIKYYRNSMYMETTQVFDMKDVFPAVTLCLRRSVKKYCNLDLTREMFQPNFNQPCAYEFSPRSRNKEIITEDKHEKSWRNGVFDIACLQGKDCKKGDISKELIKTSSKYHSCVTWNYRGGYTNTRGVIELSVTVRDNTFNGRVDYIEAMVHDCNVDGSIQTDSIPLFARRSHYLKFTKSTLKRLFENCQKTKAPDVFPGGYSVSGCIMSVSCLNMLEKCKGVYDICRHYLPTEKQANYIRNNTLSAMKTCLSNLDNSTTSDLSQCRSSCKEVIFDVDSFSYDSNEGFNQFSVTLQNKWRHSSNEMTERYTYDIYDLIGTIGTWIFITITLSTTLYLHKKTTTE